MNAEEDKQKIAAHFSVHGPSLQTSVLLET
jgi:hypothetical protein